VTAVEEGCVPGDPHTAIDLFAGAGGLSLGFGRRGFTTVAAVELDRDAARSFRWAHPAAGGRAAPLVVEDDICRVDFTRFRGRVDAVIGGPPCQPWSLGGLRQGHGDPRDGIPQFARAVREVAPAAFVMENVAGLVRGAARAAFARIVAVLGGERPLSDLLGSGVPVGARLDYGVTYRVLDAADFGVPQSRRRLFVVGVRPGLSFAWPAPTHGPGRPRPHVTAGEVLVGAPAGEPNPSVVTYAARPSLRPDPYHGQVFNGGGRPIDPARPAPTLLASMGGNKTPWVDTLGIVPAYHRHLRAGGAPRSGLVPGGRRITVAEAAALQTFPADMAFAGPRSSQYRQVGNAVPPALAAAVAGALAAALGPPVATVAGAGTRVGAAAAGS
jgi:DNA (cytosine-5)-methyltransferase 1